MNIKHLIKWHGARNIPLNFQEAYELGCEAVHACRRWFGAGLARVQTIVALSQIHTRATYTWHIPSGHVECECRLPEDASEMIAGVCAAIFEHDIGKSSAGFLEVDATDNCGMGGDLVVTANVSTLAGLIAANAGVKVCKHGSPANADAGRHGSSDFVKLLGTPTMATKWEVEQAVRELGFGYTEALDRQYKSIHRQTHQFAKLPHMNDLVGPITNPVNPRRLRRRIIGVNHLVEPVIVARAYRRLNEYGITDMQHLLCVRGHVYGRGGVDEVSLCYGGTSVAELRDGKIMEYPLYAHDFGIERPVPADEISPPAGMSKGEFSLRILRGEERGGARTMVLANAALLLYLHERGDLVECYKIAEASLHTLPAYAERLRPKASTWAHGGFRRWY